jgi:heavy metal sensor kinase
VKGHISISLRLTILFGTVFFLGWVLFGTSMWVNLRRTLKNERRQTLTRRMDRLQDVQVKNQKEVTADRYQDFADFAHATGNGLSEIFRPDGTRAYPSPSPAAAAFPWPNVQGEDSERFVAVQVSGQPYWVLARRFSLEGQPLILLAAAPDAANIMLLQRFLQGLLASAPILLLISSAGGYWISRRALQPVDRIVAKARSISIGNLSERLPVTDTGDELQRIAETCNAMLGRLESAVSQIRRFTADASHELRGPLSFTRTVAEVALRNPGIDLQSRQAFQDIVDEAAKAATLLEEMLTLARSDAGPVSLPMESVDLGILVEEVCEMARPFAIETGLSLAIVQHKSTAIKVLGDFSSLRRLIWILVDNALKYTPAPGMIELSLIASAESTTLSVRDTGIGISAADLPHIFDRFYRADPSRGMVEGNGLGLSIAKWIAEIHQAQLKVSSQERAGSIFSLTFPISIA